MSEGKPSFFFGSLRKTQKQTINPPTPVERVDGSQQLGLPSESLIEAEGFWDCWNQYHPSQTYVKGNRAKASPPLALHADTLDVVVKEALSQGLRLQTGWRTSFVAGVLFCKRAIDVLKISRIL